MGVFVCILIQLLHPWQTVSFMVPTIPSQRGRLRRSNTIRAAQLSNTGDQSMGPVDPTLSVTTFNVLAPIFKRMGPQRESDFRDIYLERHAAIIQHLKVRRGSPLLSVNNVTSERPLLSLTTPRPRGANPSPNFTLRENLIPVVLASCRLR